MRDCALPLKHLKVLEYGCAEGWITLDIAERGGNLHVFDLSEDAVTDTGSILKNNQLFDRLNLQIMAAEELNYKTQSMGVAFGFAMPHHLQVEIAL